jgi:hypothetical protein
MAKKKKEEPKEVTPVDKLVEAANQAWLAFVEYTPLHALEHTTETGAILAGKNWEKLNVWMDALLAATRVSDLKALTQTAPQEAMNSTTALVDAAEKVWRASINFGPVDDGRPEGTAFDEALDALMRATKETKYDPLSAYVPTLVIRVRCVKMPNGRGRNAHHWEATTRKGEHAWTDPAKGSTEAVVIGKIIVSHQQSGNKPPVVEIQYESK